MTSDKIREYAGLLYEFENEDGAPYLKMLLKKMRISTKNLLSFLRSIGKSIGLYLFSLSLGRFIHYHVARCAHTSGAGRSEKSPLHKRIILDQYQPERFTTS
jgi:hypothetical protein